MTTKGQEEELVNFDDAEIEEDQQSKSKATEQKDLKKYVTRNVNKR